jgi:hypothetical protein
VEVFTPGGQASLEMDCSGNLWAVDQYAQRVYVADSGEDGVCNWQATWLSAVPASGSVAPGNSIILSVKVDATSLLIGTYTAYLRMVSDTPYNDRIIPVTLMVVDRLNLYLPSIHR